MNNSLVILKNNLDKVQLKNKFTNQKQYNTFKSNIMTIVQNNTMLQNVDPNSLIASSLQATYLDLELNPSFGHAYVVPYNKKAQFQIGYKGLIQLAQRSGRYVGINTTDVREGEVVNYDRLKGIEFTWIQDERVREATAITGYVAWFKLSNGYEQMLYMTKAQMEAHFLKYSKTYQKQQKFTISDFDTMAKKTCLKLLLNRFGPLSVEMKTAIDADQAVVNEDNSFEYVDNPHTYAEKADTYVGKDETIVGIIPEPVVNEPVEPLDELDDVDL